jgi:hypothetical protein
MEMKIAPAFRLMVAGARPWFLLERGRAKKGPESALIERLVQFYRKKNSKKRRL